MKLSTDYLIGSMLDPLVAEFMPPKYCEAMLEVQIRTDEMRRSCPPRAGYVCVSDPRVQNGHYYRKHVAGEGINALPPSRLEKSLNRYEQKPQGGGIGILGKIAIGGGLAIGSLAAIGAIANSGRSSDTPETPETNKREKPEKPTSEAYTSNKESAKQQLLAPKNRRMGSDEVANNGVISVPPKDSPKEARRKRGQVQTDPLPSPSITTPLIDLVVVPPNQQIPKDVKPNPQPNPSPLLNAVPKVVVPLSPESTGSPKPKKQTQSATVLVPDPVTLTGRASATIKEGYESNAISDVPGTYGYKTLSGVKDLLAKKGTISRGTTGKNELDAMLDNNMLVEKGLLVQTEGKNGRQLGFGKDNVGMVRIPAFTPAEKLSAEASAIAAGAGTIAQRIPRSRKLIEAISEKLNDPSLTEDQ